MVTLEAEVMQIFSAYLLCLFIASLIVISVCCRLTSYIQFSTSKDVEKTNIYTNSNVCHKGFILIELW